MGCSIIVVRISMSRDLCFFAYWSVKPTTLHSFICYVCGMHTNWENRHLLLSHKELHTRLWPDLSMKEHGHRLLFTFYSDSKLMAGVFMCGNLMFIQHQLLNWCFGPVLLCACVKYSPSWNTTVQTSEECKPCSTIPSLQNDHTSWVWSLIIFIFLSPNGKC